MTEDRKRDDGQHLSLSRAQKLLFFAYRDFTRDADAVLAHYGFGRAHHRVLYFVGENPGITISELLAILKITKQSLARVLRQLVTENLIRRETGRQDRRQRRLVVTSAGQELIDALSTVQHRRLAQAFASAGGEAVAGFAEVLEKMIDPQDLHRIAP